MDEPLIEEAYQKAIEILKNNSTKYGFTASTLKEENYYSIWSRDSSICTIAAVKTKDKELIETGKNSMKILLKKLSENGQVPSYIEIENKHVEYGGFGSITSVDSNMWVMIACSQVYKHTKSRTFLSDEYIDKYFKLMKHLYSFDPNDDGLLEIPDAGDWADIMGRRYHILYDQNLYFQALKEFEFIITEKKKMNNISKENLKKYIKAVKSIRKRKRKLKMKLNSLFWVNSNEVKQKLRENYMIYHKLPKENFLYYQSHILPFKHYWMRRFDTFGNILTITCGVTDDFKAKKIIKHIIDNHINFPISVKCLWPAITEKDKDYLHIYSLKEKPYTYHNGGIWPMISGFWIGALMRKSKKRIAFIELKKLTVELAKTNWTFPEYFHGKTGEPMGKKYMAWSAAGYIFAYQSIKGFKIFR